VTAEDLRKRAAKLLHEAECKTDAFLRRVVIELATAFLERARDLDAQKKLN
jgi:hypothetical protein